MTRSRERNDRANSSREEFETRKRSRSRENYDSRRYEREPQRRDYGPSHRRNDNRSWRGNENRSWRDNGNRPYRDGNDRSYQRSPRRNDRPRQYSPPSRDGGRKRYREPSPERPRVQGRDSFQEPRSNHNARGAKRGRHSGSFRASSDRRGSTPGRLTPSSYDDRSYQGSSDHDRSRPTSRGDSEQDENAKKADRLARVQALKEKHNAEVPSKKTDTANETSQQVAHKFTSSLLKASTPSMARDGDAPKKVDKKKVQMRAAASLAKHKASMPSGSLKANIAKMEAMKVAATTSDPEELASTLAAAADDDVDNDNIGSDDEGNDTARKLAHERALNAQQSLPVNSSMHEQDPSMQDGDEEVDPLDAYMNTIQLPEEAKVDYLRDIRGGKSRALRAFNSDDEDTAIDAMGIGELDGPTKKVKVMPVVNHAEMNYEAFRKNFYTESAELARLTDDELEIIRAELDNITVTGKKVPKPIQSFAQGGLGTQLLEVIKDLQFEKPTAIQAQALPAIMSGRDTLAVAKTGSGKTMAYLLPMFRHVKDQRPLQNLEGPIALILVPTRELAVQVHKECKPFLARLNLRAVVCYGGSSISDNIAELKRGAEIVVATPGRMIDLIAANSGRVTNLARVTYLVHDEADRMFDMGFDAQVKILDQNIRPNRQTVLFSATLPAKMESFALRALKNPVRISVGGRSTVADEIEQIIEVIKPEEKFGRLLHYLGHNHKHDDGSRSLVFVERQETADQLHSEMFNMGYAVHSIHGGRDQTDRDQFITDFKQGIIDVLIATSLAARGLDVKQLNLVINYDCPNHHEDYVHRCGRTGRAGNKGTAVTLITPDQKRFAKFLVKALEESKRPVPANLQKLADIFKRKVQAGEEQEFSSGYGGHGMDRMQTARDNQRALVAQRYGADGTEIPVEQLIQNEKDKEKKKTEAEKVSSSTPYKEEWEQLLKEAMNVRKTEAPPPVANKRGYPGQSGMTALERAAAAAANVNSRLGARGATRADTSMDVRSPDAGAYYATLMVNDFPQEARWAVTQRQKVVRVLDATGTSVTSKGQFYPPGTVPGPDEPPKLYCLVEGDTQTAVESAMRALVELVKEGLRRHETDAASRVAASSRYTVV